MAEALEICKKYHQELWNNYYNGGAGNLTNEQLNELREAHIQIYNRGFDTCCSGPITQGIRNVSSWYIQQLKNG